MSPDEQLVRELHSTFIAAINAGDHVRLLTLMTDDVVLLGPGQAPIGQDGFSAVHSGAHQEHLIHCTSELQEVVVMGDVAYTWCQDSLSVAPRVGGDTAHLAGHRLTVYRRQPDGRWLLARDAHTLTPVEK